MLLFSLCNLTLYEVWESLPTIMLKWLGKFHGLTDPTLFSHKSVEWHISGTQTITFDHGLELSYGSLIYRLMRLGHICWWLCFESIGNNCDYKDLRVISVISIASRNYKRVNYSLLDKDCLVLWYSIICMYAFL